MNDLTLTSIEIDLERNLLRLNIETAPDGLDREPAFGGSASIDIGTGGRLLGVDLGDRYVPVMPPGPDTEAMVRSAYAEVEIVREGETREPVSITVPRRGAGYEIAYPSGNQ